MMMWIGFGALIIALLVLDLSVFHRKNREIKSKEAFIWTAFWILLAFAFGAGIFIFQGSENALQYLTGYVIEKSLSVDNLFVFLAVFSYFQVQPAYQHKVLFYGIISALVMRGLLIFLGITLIHQFSWIFYILGFLLIALAIRLFFQKDLSPNPQKNILIKSLERRIQLAEDTSHFFIKYNGKWRATKLLWVLFAIEITDLVFAVDSIPAIFAVTQDPFIIYSSNIFAMLGLRSLYFVLSASKQFFYYLKYGLAIVLGFVGLKMLFSYYVHIPTILSLLVVLLILAMSVIVSIMFPKRQFSNNKPE